MHDEVGNACGNVNRPVSASFMMVHFRIVSQDSVFGQYGVHA